VDKKMALNAFARSRRGVSPKSWWLRQIQEHPIATGSAVLTVTGGLILLVFFCQLGETPDLDAKAIGAIPWAMAILALFLSVILTICVFFVGALHRGQEKSLAGLGEKTLAGFLILPGMAGVAVMFGYSWVDPNGRWSGVSMAAPLVFTLLASAIVVGLEARSRAEPHSVRRKGWSKAKRFSELAGVGVIWALMPYLAVLVYWYLFPSDRTPTEFVWGLIFWTLCSYALNYAVARAPKRSVLAFLSLACVVGVIALLSSTGNWSSIPKGALSLSGLGEMPVKLVLTANGCDLLNKAVGSREVCRVAPGEKTAVVCPAILRSRISSPFFVEVSAYESRGGWPQMHPPKRFEAIAIPKEDAPTWTRLDYAKRSASTPPPAASEAVVTYLDAEDKGAWLRDQCGEAPAASPTSASSALAPVSAPPSAPSTQRSGG